MKAHTRWMGLIPIAIVLMMFAFSGLAQAQESAWWNDQWQYRRKISFDASPTGADIKSNLSDLPVLVRLHVGNFGNSGDTGEDIRFVGADGKTLLKHHIEKFDPIDQIGYIWVRLPKLSGGGAQDYIWMYYGNREAVGGQDSAGTFESGYAAVFHLDELEGAPKDATAYHNNAGQFQGGQGLPSVIGNGVALNGAGDGMVIPANPSLDFAKGFTFSAWVRIHQPQEAATLFVRQEEDGKGMLIDIQGTKACFQITAANGQVYRTQECPDLSLEAWHHVAFTAQPNGRMEVYLDGLEAFYLELPTALPKASGDLFVGKASGGGSFIGDLDEIRISGISRTSDWIRAAFKTQGPESLLAQVGVEESGGGGSGLPVFYIATIMKNISLDGWFIIGCLAVLGIMGWVVIISKATMLYSVEKENKSFRSVYQEVPDPIEFQQNGKIYDNSTLFRVFTSGHDALKRCLEKNGSSPGIPGTRGISTAGPPNRSKRLWRRDSSKNPSVSTPTW